MKWPVIVFVENKHLKMMEEEEDEVIMEERQQSNSLSAPQLTVTDSAAVCSIMEDCIDQLVVLGTIIPKTFETRSNIQEV